MQVITDNDNDDSSRGQGRNGYDCEVVQYIHSSIGREIRIPVLRSLFYGLGRVRENRIQGAEWVKEANKCGQASPFAERSVSVTVHTTGGVL